MLPTFASLNDLLLYRAEHQPDYVGFTFLDDGEHVSSLLSYSQLSTRALAIAATLQQQLAPGERVLLLLPAGTDFVTAFFGCLCAGMIAVPAYPPRPNQSLRRIETIIGDAQPKLILTTTSVLPALTRQLESDAMLAQVPYLAIDDITHDMSSRWTSPDVQGETLAFLQYTSGSTGEPKGVKVSHANLLHNLGRIHTCFGHSSDSRGVIWLPPYHDMGLIGGLLQPLYGGFPVVLMPPFAFLQKPIRWLKAISDYRGTTSGGPNFAFDLCVEKIRPEQLEGLDLSCWTLAFSGAEPVRVETLERFAAKFAPYGFRDDAFYPCYGMAETTLLVAGGSHSQKPRIQSIQKSALQEKKVVSAINDIDSVRLVSCGTGGVGEQICIVDPITHMLCAPDDVGEIWVASPSVAQGYWQQPEKSQHIFQATLAGAEQTHYLRTGDLGFIHHQELFITGRSKDVLILRGQNHYPQDIEWSVQRSHGALSPNAGAAFSVLIDGEEKLIVVQEVKRTHIRKLNEAEVTCAARKLLSEEYAIHLHTLILVKPASLPKTSSGKVQRTLCKNQFLQGTLSTLMGNSIAFAETNGTIKPAAEPKRSPNVLYQATAATQPCEITTERLNLNQSDISKIRADNLIDWLRHYGSERINSQLIDSRRCIPPYVVLDFGNRGLLGMQAPEAFGGLNLTYRDSLRVFEQLAAVDLTLASFVGVHHALGTRPVMNWAKPEVRAEILPLLATGRELGAFAMTESGAGSNPRAISTVAIPDGQGGWHLQGHKTWIGHGSWAGVVTVFAQILNDRHQPVGMGGFLVRQGTKGLIQGPEALTMGMRGMVQNALFFENVAVGLENLLGDVGQGMAIAQDAMMVGRLGLGALSLGGIKRCAQLMLRYASGRTISTGRLLDNPVTMVRVSELTAMMTAVESLLYEVAALLDAGETVPEDVYAACKTTGTEFLWRAIDQTVQALGGRGYMENNGVPQMLRDARLLRIFEGPTETLHWFMGSRLMSHSQGIDRFLSHSLRLPNLAQELTGVVEQIKARYTGGKSAFADDMAALRWAQSCAGEIGSFFMLLAAVQKQLDRQPSDALKHAKHWLRLHLERKISSALVGISSEQILSQGMMSQLSEMCTATIGDLEQRLAGEDHGLDPFLKKPSTPAIAYQNQISLALQHGHGINGYKPHDQEPQPITSPSAMNGHDLSLKQAESLNSGMDLGVDATLRVASTPTNKAVTAESIHAWIEAWLSRQLKIPDLSLKAESTFAEYGIDSVMAVELAQDLGDWLNQPLDATILWNLPTLKDLTAYLIQRCEIVSASVDTVLSTKVNECQELSSESVSLPLDPTNAGLIQELSRLEQLLQLNTTN